MYIEYLSQPLAIPDLNVYPKKCLFIRNKHSAWRKEFNLEKIKSTPGEKMG